METLFRIRVSIFPFFSLNSRSQRNHTASVKNMTQKNYRSATWETSTFSPVTNKRFHIQVGNAFQLHEGTPQGYTEQVTNHLGQQDNQHCEWGGMDVICEFYLRTKWNKRLYIFFIKLEMKAMVAQDYLLLSQGNGKQFPCWKGKSAPSPFPGIGYQATLPPESLSWCSDSSSSHPCMLEARHLH